MRGKITKKTSKELGYVRMQTGTTATAQAVVDIQYRCSSCGEDNLATGTIEGSAYTATIMGINLDRRLTKHASEVLQEKLAVVLDQNDPKRFRVAGFTCKCKTCGHAEPWARMNYDKLSKPSAVSLSFLVVSALVILIGIGSGPLNFMHFLIFSILALSTAACIAISTYKSRHSAKMEQLIAELPPESLPVILPYSAERHETFHREPEKSPTVEVVYDKWICKECGTPNSMQYAQCKKCGKFKKS